MIWIITWLYSCRYYHLWTIMNKLEVGYKLFSILNFLAFLFDGKYVSLVNRILGMRLFYRSSSARRHVSFEYMNRQLVWHGFTVRRAPIDSIKYLINWNSNNNPFWLLLLCIIIIIMYYYYFDIVGVSDLYYAPDQCG